MGGGGGGELYIRFLFWNLFNFAKPLRLCPSELYSWVDPRMGNYQP